MVNEDMVNRNEDRSTFDKGVDFNSKGFTNGMGKGRVLTDSGGLTNGNGMTNGLSRPEGLVNGSGVTNGLTNGLVNGTGVTNGLTNGLVNGTGVTNGLTNGLVNGTGITNGFTNGLSAPMAGGVTTDDRAISPKKTSLVIIIVVLLLIPSIFFMYTYDEPVFEGLRVDGDFSEWSEVNLYTDTGTASTTALDISNYAITTNDRNDKFIYAQSQGSWMSSTSADSLIVFIDEDDSAATGYTIENMGADYLIEVYGWDNAIQSKQFSGYDGSDQNNWSAWGFAGGLSAAISGNQMEISIASTVHLFGDDAKFMFMTKRGSEIGEICSAQISEGQGALVVKQTPMDANGIIGSNTVMELELTAYGSAVTVNTISFAQSGVGSASVSGLPVTVSVGSPATLNVEAPVTSLTQGTYVEVSVSAVTGDGSVNIIGHDLQAYANAPPAGISIDGAFADWAVINKSSDTANDVGNPNVDIADYASVNSTTQAFFYLKVSNSGQIFTGGSVPQARERPETPGEPGEPGEPGTPKPLPRKTGEDITRIYIDTIAGGQNIGGIWADHLIEIKGINGDITSRRLYSLPGKHFIKNIDAANGIRELEAGLALTDIGYTGNLTAYFETTDWENNEDEVTPVDVNALPASSGTRSGGDENSPAGFGTATVFDSDAVVYTSTVFDTSNNVIVVAYRDPGNANRGTAIVGTVTGTDIAFGSPVVFASGLDIGWISAAFDSSNNMIVIAYRNGGSGVGTAIVGTVDLQGAGVADDTINFGTAAAFEASSTLYISSAFDSSNNKVVIAYQNASGFKNGTAIVGTVDLQGAGTADDTLTFGNAVVFEAAETTQITSTFDSTINKAVIAYQDSGNSNYGTAIVGTISGTDIIFGNAQVFESATTTALSATFDSSNGNVVIAYSDNSNGKAMVGTVSDAGTPVVHTDDTILFGTVEVFETVNIGYTSAIFDSNKNEVVISYRNVITGDGTAVVGTVDLQGAGTADDTMVFGTPQVFEANPTLFIAATYDSSSNNKVVIAYQGNSAGTAIVMAPEFPTPLIPILVIVAIPLIIIRRKRSGGERV